MLRSIIQGRPDPDEEIESWGPPNPDGSLPTPPPAGPMNMASEPTCGQSTPDGTCWKVAGHPGPCQG